MGSDGDWLYRCSKCQEYKDRCEFHSDKSKPPFNIAYNCKVCRTTRNEMSPILKDWEQQEGIRVLQILGYDINENIHEQFIIKVERKYGIYLSQ